MPVPSDVRLRWPVRRGGGGTTVAQSRSTTVGAGRNTAGSSRPWSPRGRRCWPRRLRDESVEDGHVGDCPRRGSRAGTL